jgi:HTH-type transcriptional regulator / antitoxin MqsA
MNDKIKTDIVPCQACEAGKLHYDVRDVEISRRGLSVVVPSVAGWFCDSCEEIDFDEHTDSGDRFAAAGDELVLAARKQVGAALRTARAALKLTQADAALIAGGGHNAFSRYETGAAQPVSGVVHLFELLVRHPELLDEVREMSRSAAPKATSTTSCNELSILQDMRQASPHESRATCAGDQTVARRSQIP